MTDKKTTIQYPMPFVRIELVLMCLQEGALSVVLAKRGAQPYRGQWALPGGVLKIDTDKDLSHAACRIAKERLGVELPYLHQQCSVGSATRDPRSPWSLSVVYRALVPSATLNLVPGKRVQELRWRLADEASSDPELAFDHSELVAQAVQSLKDEVEDLNIPLGLMPDKFTLGELQTGCEGVLGYALDKSSFRRRLADKKCVTALTNQMKTGPFRPAQLFSLAGQSEQT